MQNELFNIFDDNGNHVGTASRNEVHRLGYWHEVFHCWFIGNEAGVDYIYLQIRSDIKKDYPSLFDITAAGHLLAHETIEDGVREVQEEIGIKVSIEELIPLGVIRYWVETEKIIDKELAHVYLYESSYGFDDFTLQQEEVKGMLRISFSSFYELWLGNVDEIEVEGFIAGKIGEKVFFKETAGKEKFVAHEQSYYEQVLHAIQHYLQNK